MTNNYYQILELEDYTKIENIWGVKISLTRKYQDDSERLAAIDEAFDVLTSQRLKQIYDGALPQGHEVAVGQVNFAKPLLADQSIRLDARSIYIERLKTRFDDLEKELNEEYLASFGKADAKYKSADVERRELQRANRAVYKEWHREIKTIHDEWQKALLEAKDKKQFDCDVKETGFEKQLGKIDVDWQKDLETGKATFANLKYSASYQQWESELITAHVESTDPKTITVSQSLRQQLDAIDIHFGEQMEGLMAERRLQTGNGSPPPYRG